MNLETIAASIALILLLALAIFQILLIAKVPLGRFAWGGQHDVLPAKLRIGSVISIAIYGFIAVLIVSKAGLLQIIPTGPFLDISTWVIFGYLALGIPLNAMSRSKPERYTMTPVVLVLVVCLLMVALA